MEVLVLDQISYGLIMQELERGDSAVRSAASVQVLCHVSLFMSLVQKNKKRKYLPKLASGEFIGAFGLTEPNHGSNPGNGNALQRYG